tara:strand:+ start:158 stop:367 length:210 start_codon:yes stop_codon:yes gene_type:complete
MQIGRRIDKRKGLRERDQNVLPKVLHIAVNLWANGTRDSTKGGKNVLVNSASFLCREELHRTGGGEGES